jgi:hypothetical protein
MDLSERSWPRSDLRAGDADRQSVVAELQRHFVEGRLSSEELSERVSQALEARTFGDLAATLRDLPPLETRLQRGSRDWRNLLSSQPLGAALILVGVLALLWLLVLPATGGHGFLPFWPVLIWGFFFIGRPYRGGRRF